MWYAGDLGCINERDSWRGTPVEADVSILIENGSYPFKCIEDDYTSVDDIISNMCVAHLNKNQRMLNCDPSFLFGHINVRMVAVGMIHSSIT